MIDWSPVVQPVISIAGTILTGVALNLGYWMNRKLKLGRDTELNQRVAAAAEAAAGLAYSAMSQGTPRDQAIKKGADYVCQGMPAIIAELGLTPDRVSQMVEARLGKLLAVDPTIKLTAAVK